jgi:hypothetical protein
MGTNSRINNVTNSCLAHITLSAACCVRAAAVVAAQWRSMLQCSACGAAAPGGAAPGCSPVNQGEGEGEGQGEGGEKEGEGERGRGEGVRTLPEGARMRDCVEIPFLPPFPPPSPPPLPGPRCAGAHHVAVRARVGGAGSARGWLVRHLLCGAQVGVVLRPLPAAPRSPPPPAPPARGPTRHTRARTVAHARARSRGRPRRAHVTRTRLTRT